MQFMCTQRLYDPAVGHLASGAVSDDAAEFGLEALQAGDASLDCRHLLLRRFSFLPLTTYAA
jgi:hypothetical protein